MSGFSAEWLALREPADASARSARAAQVLASRFSSDRELVVFDLGAGTGANARFLMEHLPARQRWILVDNDADLLDTLPDRMRSWGAARGYAVTAGAGELVIRNEHLDCRITPRQVDLSSGLDQMVDERCNVVTASALLDLVSREWLERLVTLCARRRTCALFALTYDGRIVCAPRDAEDEVVRELVNRHQRTDKGFGPALGPDAAAATHACFARASYDIHTEASDWMLDARHAELQRQLIRGWADAARAISPDQSTTIEGWRDRRLAHVDASRSRIIVGHTDLIAWPTTHGPR